MILRTSTTRAGRFSLFFFDKIIDFLVDFWDSILVAPIRFFWSKWSLLVYHSQGQSETELKVLVSID